MFNLFGSKNRCLGLDIGTTGVKSVELKKEGNMPVLVNYAISYDSGSLLQSSDLEILDGQTKEIVLGIVKKAGFKGNRVVVGIPGFLALISFMEIPEMPKNEIDQAVRFEANKYIPTPIEEVSLGWDIIGSYQEKPLEGGQVTKQKQKLQIMVVTVPNNAVAKLTTIAKESGLSPIAMEVENFATVRCLVGNDKGTFMIVNMGAKATDLTIVSDGIVRVTRSIDVGGAEISRSLASGLGIDLERADKLKKSSQIDLTNPNDKLSGLVGPVIGMVIDEVKRLREIYHKKNPIKKIEKLIFTGGTSKLSSLLDYFASELSIECQMGNSLARVAVDKKYQEVTENVAPELTVAIGLALRGIEST
ncbi:MAG: type IV pilus assembly protein PilM [Parcubacteria group bacterium]|jgi:type IV pilus assembly protein PilM